MKNNNFFSLMLILILGASCASGPSMMAFSGFRLVRMAHERGLPIASLNLGITRADEMVTLNIKADCVEVLNALDQKLA